jgi:16S rRNA (uracil1498-N3)-methyltransferase
MQLFYAPNANLLPEDDSRHAVKVLRMGVGDRLHVTDGRGNLFEARISAADPKRCEVEILETFANYGRRPYRLEMAVAPTKNPDRYEWFLEKATEIGVDAIVPIECANSERRIFFKPDRAQRVLIGAMKQSLKAYIPDLQTVTPVRELIERPFDGVRLIAHCRAEKTLPERIPIIKALAAGANVQILIGPEGDFTVDEVALAIANGFVSISLGDSRLRTETAALMSVSAVYLKNLK